MTIDLDDLLNKPCMDVWAIDVTYQPFGEASFPFRGEFRREPFDDEQGEVTVMSRTPLLGVRLSEFPEGIVPQYASESNENDLVVVEGQTYEVVGIDDSGSGHAWLHLQKV